MTISHRGGLKPDKQDTPDEMKVQDGRLIVAAAKVEGPNLAKLLDKVTPESLHPENSFGPALGREVW